MGLAGYLPPVVAEVVAEIGKYSAGMAEVKQEMSALEATTTKLAAVGKVAFAGLAVGVAAVGFESTKLAMNFDQTMELIHTQAGASQSEVDSLKKSVLDLAPTVGIGPEKLAEGLYHIESTGMRGAAAIDTLKQSAKLAAVGMADLDDVTYAMSGVMSVGMQDVKDAADAVSYLNATVGMGDMRMSQLTAAIGTGILPSFRSAGLGMKDFSAALATIADNSTPADEAATRLRMTISMMAAPSGPAREALHSIGLEATDLATDLRQPNGLLVAVQDLKKHLEDSGKTAVEQNAIMEQAFGGGKTSGSILTLLEEVDRLKSKYDQLGTAESRAAATDDAWAQQQKQFAQQWHEFTAQVQVLGVKIGEWLIPKLQSAVEWVNQNSEAAKVLAGVIGGVLLVAITAYAVEAVTAAVASVIAFWEVYLAIAVLAGAIYGIYELIKHWSTVWNWAKGVAQAVWGWLVNAWHSTVDAFIATGHWIKTKLIDPVAAWFHDAFVVPITNITRGLVIAFRFAFGFISVIVDDFRHNWDIAWAAISFAAKWTYDNVLKPTFDFIVKWGIEPLVGAVLFLVKLWGIAWDGISFAAKWAWENILKPTFEFIDKWGIQPVKGAVGDLRHWWDVAWDAITHAVTVAYDKLKPIFDFFSRGIGAIKSGVTDLAEHPFEAGQKFAHLLGFDTGGVVPGPVGAPTLAVVHGGEEILTPDQRAIMGRGGGAGGSGGGLVAAAGGGDQVINQRLTLDSRVVWQGQLRLSRRKGLTGPAALYPATARAI